MGESPIHNAAKYGNIEAVKQHLDAGANVNAKPGSIEFTPLHYAAREGHKEIAELLIAIGTFVNVKLKDGRTPLDLTKRHPEIADFLRKHDGKTGEELKSEGK
jgi:ankyrin repeat protein